MRRVTRRKNIIKSKRKNTKRVARYGGGIQEIISEMRELIQKPNSKYMFSTNTEYDEMKDKLMKVNMSNLSEYDENTYQKLLEEMKRLQWSHLTDTQRKELIALVSYERDPERELITYFTKQGLNHMSVDDRIRTIVDQQPPLTKELVVWRGHAARPSSIKPISWFSTTLDKDIASEKFLQGHKCCLFKIHLQPGVKIIDLYKLYTTYGVTNPYDESNRFRSLIKNRKLLKPFKFDYINDKEIIVDEGGKFYKNKEKTEEGFQPIQAIYTKFKGTSEPMIYYEAYYFPKDPDYVHPKDKSYLELLYNLSPNNLD